MVNIKAISKGYYMNERPKTIFLDIDGTILYHYGTLQEQLLESPKMLPGVKEKLHEWDRKGYYIVLTTGRRECSRKQTKKQLADLGIFYNQLIMDITGGTRVIVNDRKSDGTITAGALCPIRNAGIKDLEI